MVAFFIKLSSSGCQLSASALTRVLLAGLVGLCGKDQIFILFVSLLTLNQQHKNRQLNLIHFLIFTCCV